MWLVLFHRLLAVPCTRNNAAHSENGVVDNLLTYQLQSCCQGTKTATGQYPDFGGTGIHVFKLLLDFRAQKQQAVFAVFAPLMAALPPSLCNALHAALCQFASRGSCGSHVLLCSAFTAGPSSTGTVLDRRV